MARKHPKDKRRAKLKRQRRLQKQKSGGITYICQECSIKERIPEEVVRYFDILDDGDKSIPPRFTCENCGGIMYPEKYTSVDGIEYSTKN